MTLFEKYSAAAYEYDKQIDVIIWLVHHLRKRGKPKFTTTLSSLNQNIDFINELYIQYEVIPSGHEANSRYEYIPNSTKLENGLIILSVSYNTSDIDLRIMLYHEINHLKFSLEILKKNKEDIDKYFDYPRILYFSNMINNKIINNVHNLNIICNKKQNQWLTNDNYNFDESYPLEKYMNLFWVLYRWFSDSEIYAYNSEIFLELAKYASQRSIANTNNDIFDFTEIMNDKSRLYIPKLKVRDYRPKVFQDIEKTKQMYSWLLNEEFLIKNVQQLFKFPQEMSDKKFVRWFKNKLTKNVDDTEKRVKRIIRTYNKTIQQAVNDEYISKITNVSELFQYMESDDFNILTENIMYIQALNQE